MDKHLKAIEKDKQLTVPPEQLNVELTCRDPVPADTTRYLCFRNYRGETRAVAIALERAGERELAGACTPAGLEVLQSLAYTGSRNFWDQMSLENHGDQHALMIEHLEIEIHYHIKKDSAEDDHQEHMRIVDSAIAAESAAGNSAIDLEPWARESRCRLAGLDFRAHPAVILAVHDLGKCGSDGTDQFSKNPKYASPSQRLCSEFVSWYYHEAGVVVNEPGEFRRIDLTHELREVFARAKRLYSYHNSTGKFVHTESKAEYHPRSGDFLERRKDGVSKHSMLVVSWDDEAKAVVVVNGPWPVTLRRIELSTVEQTKDVDFWLGRVSPY